MLKKHRFKVLMSVFLVLLLALTACGSNGGGGSDKASGKSKTTSSKKNKKNNSKSNSKDKTTNAKRFAKINSFPKTTTNNKQAIKDGTLHYAIVYDTPFEGTLSQAYSTGVPDQDILQFLNNGLFFTDKNYRFTNNGPASYKMSNGNKTMTITIKDSVKWSDGKPVTAQDYQYAFHVIGNKAYTGVRYGSPMNTIVGMKAYHEGKAKTISGIKILGDKKLSITFTHANPAILSGLWSYPMPKHYLKGVAIKDLAKSDKIHKHPLGFGPYVVSKIVPGESVVMTPNKYYWNGTPGVKKLIIKVVNPNSIVDSLKNGSIDIAEVSGTKYTQVKDLKNIQLLDKIGLSYSYIGFKLGHYDKKKGVCVMDRKKMQNVKLRQAMAYALDMQKVADKFYNSLRAPANSLIPPSFAGFYDKSLNGYDFNPAKAKKLLDQAGYKDTNGDGLREDPNGKKFVINYLAMSGGKYAEPIAKYEIQAWKSVGLDVQLVGGRLHEFNSFYKMVENDSPKVDVFAGAWSTGTSVDQTGLYGKHAQFNLERWVNPKNTKLLQEQVSPKAANLAYRQKVLDQWQKLTMEKLPAIPTLFRSSLYAVNKRVKNFSIDPSNNLSNEWGKVAVTSKSSK